MNRALQCWLLTLYRVSRNTGVLSTPLGRSVFQAAYGGYKTYLEARFVDLLRKTVKPGWSIIDVGANIGYLTRKFGKWVSEGGRVIAIEPESGNYRELTKAVAKAGLGGVVETLCAAVDEASGGVTLQIDPIHPGGHRLGPAGVPVTAFAIDDLLAARGWPMVCLIKIDVQGAEDRVISGAAETIHRFHPALFVEIDDSALKLFHSSANSILTKLSGLGYLIHRLEKGNVSQAMTVAGAVEFQEARGYADFLFLNGGTTSQ